MRAKAFNPQIFLEFICYCFFGGLMLHLVSSGKYLSYVTPRMGPYLYFTAIVMLLWACTGLFRLFRPQHRVRSAHCLVLAIPVLLLLIPHNPLSASDLSGNYIGGGAFSSRSGQNLSGLPQKQAFPDGSGLNSATGIPAEPESSGMDTATGVPDESDSSGPDASAGIPEDSAKSGDGSLDDQTDPTDAAIPDNTPDAVPDTGTDPSADGASADLPGLDTVNRKITVPNEDFGMWLFEIYDHMDQYEGYTVVMTGSVYKDPEILKEDEFMPARLLMTCCVADLTPAGLICKYDKASGLEADSWVTVEGTLFIGQYEYEGKKYDDPQIHVTKITPAEAVDGYVYPY